MHAELMREHQQQHTHSQHLKHSIPRLCAYSASSSGSLRYFINTQMFYYQVSALFIVFMNFSLQNCKLVALRLWDDVAGWV